MSSLEPHERLLRKGKLVRWDPSMKYVFFLSHQWTSFDLPDHTGEQLRTMQSLFLRFMCGRVPDTLPNWLSRADLDMNARITTLEWMEMLHSGRVFLWIDFCSIPQMIKYHNLLASSMTAARAEQNLLKAVRSIPSYIEHCTHFFAVCPTVRHKDVADGVCDFGSWLKRGWCRLEFFALALARFNKLPVIVVKGSEVVPYMMSPITAMARMPGGGVFTCCSRNHTMVTEEGDELEIPCDREKVGNVLRTMMAACQAHHLELNDMEKHRMWKASAQMVLNGLPAHEEEVVASPRSAGAFLGAYKFDQGAGVGGRMAENSGGNQQDCGMSALHFAAWTGNAGVLRELVERNPKGGVDVRTHSSERVFGLDKGVTPLHILAGCARCEKDELEAGMKALLDAGADPNSKSARGLTPLMTAVFYLNGAGVRMLLKCTSDRLRLEEEHDQDGLSALGFAVLLSTPETIEPLLDAGANSHKIDQSGSNMLHLAVANPSTELRVLERLWDNGRLDVNLARQPRTRKLRSFYRSCERGVRLSLVSKTAFKLEMAHSRGSTPLHVAAGRGHLTFVRWLLNNGAYESLHVRNEMGATPLDVAAIFGPYVEVEAALGAAMLGHGFTSRFVLRSGSVEHKKKHDTNDKVISDGNIPTS